MMIDITDLYIPLHPTPDDSEFASNLENNERTSCIQAITKDIPPRDRDIESLIDPELECIDCGVLIPVARQRIVLTIAHTCTHCVYCQDRVQRTAKAYAKNPNFVGFD